MCKNILGAASWEGRGIGDVYNLGPNSFLKQFLCWSTEFCSEPIRRLLVMGYFDVTLTLLRLPTKLTLNQRVKLVTS